MRSLIYIVLGVLFGITMYKAETASWFRIVEMFQFQSFYMYGFMGSALIIGVIGTQIIKRKSAKDVDGKNIIIQPKDKSVSRYLFGGISFGLGWALIGACPGPIFVLLGAGTYSIIIVLLAALTGTWLYGILRDKLPH
ncbi:YeeE/YedE family protein [Flavobacterium agricola]|uniref:YeeE/YedE family protein n=1 Tax=Flavobacterium agricola TaxID=2870839 RepID=A0ABY6M1P4_9FLAO|nr:YeeE/YedE family protein [Flavobacterium agricola]UYW02465.1 YeeE/YedE family protein [Flavobacterium agricola]